MSDILEIIERIRDYNDFTSDKEVANLLNVKPDTLSQWKARNKIPFQELLEYSNLQNVSLDWILKGKRVPISSDSHSTEIPYPIPKLSVVAGAGEGIYNYEIRANDYIIIDRRLFPEIKDNKTLKAIQIYGDSMEPTIPDESYVIVDESRVDNSDGIYIIDMGGQLMVKRLQFNPNGVIDIISDNPKYNTKTHNPKDSQMPFNIYGKKILTIQ